MKKLTKNNISYVILISIVFCLASYKYGFKIACQGIILLSCIFGLTICLAILYSKIREGLLIDNDLRKNSIGCILFSLGILFFDYGIKIYAFAFSLIGTILFILFFEFVKKRR